MLLRTILPALARFLTTTLPPRCWYRCALALSWLAAGVLRLSGIAQNPRRFEQAIRLNRLLAFLTRSGREFPVPWRLSAASEALLDAATASGRGVVFCSAHLPLIKVAVRALMETGRTPAVAIAAEPGPDGQISIWGLTQRLPVIKVQPDVLLRARTVLRGGGSVLLLVDTVKGEYSPNIFRLSSLTGATVVFFTAELETGGTISIRFFHPPRPACRDKDEISANLVALEREIQRISGNLGDSGFDTVPASRLT